MGWIGSALSFFGTVFLGSLALYQNKIIFDETKKREDLSIQMELEKQIPRFYLRNKRRNGSNSNIVMEIENVSENIANDLEVFSIKFENSENQIYWKMDIKSSIHYPSLKGSEAREIKLNNPPVVGEDMRLTVDFQCKDKYGISHEFQASETFSSPEKAGPFVCKKL